MRVTVEPESSEKPIDSAAVIRCIISRRHFDNDDFSIIIPNELMDQEKHESRIYNDNYNNCIAI